MAQSENIDSQNLTSNLADALKIREKLNSKGEDANKLSAIAVSLEDQFLKQIREETKITEQIEALDDQILLLKQKMLETDDKSLKILIDQYSKYKAILSQIDKKTEALKEARKELAAVLGGSAELAETFKEAGYAALALKAAVSGFEKMGEQFSNIFGTSFDMMKTLGVSVKEAGSISSELGMANVSMTGLLYGSEATAEAAKELADQYGIAGMATTDMIKGVTQLSALTGDAASAVDLALAYENAGIAASDVKANIQEIAGSVGVNANKVAKEMAENQDLIVSATKEELALNTRLTAQLVKQGITREAIKSSSEGLMDIENTIQEANRLRLLTGKQINVAELTNAAIAVQMAEGEEEKLKAQEAFANILKNDVLPAGKKYSDLAPQVQKSLQKTLNMTDEQLLSIEKAELAQKSFTEQVTAAGGYWGYLKGLIAGSGLGLIDMGKEFVKMTAQAVIFKKIMEADSLNPLKFFKGIVKGSKEAFTTAGSFFKKMLGFGAAPITEATTTLAENVGGSVTDNLKDTAIDKAKENVLPTSSSPKARNAKGQFISTKTKQVTPTPPFGAGSGPAGALGGINATSLIKGAAALLIMAAALFVFAKALQEFKGVTGPDLAMAVAALVVFTAALFGLGALISGPGAVIFGAGVIGFLALGAALIVLGLGLQSIGAGVKMLGEVATQLAGIASSELAGGIALFGLSLIPLSAGLGALAIGLALLTPFLPTLVALNSLGIVGGSSTETSSGGDKKSKDPLLTEIQGLREDLKTLLPGNVVLNNNIVGQINRSSRAINSYVNKNG